MGDIMHVIDEAEDLLCKGIKEITAKDELDTNSLAVLGEAIDAVEDIFKIKMYKDIENGQYSDSKYSYKYSDYMVRDTMMPLTNRKYVYGRDNRFTDSNYDPHNDRNDYQRGYVRGSMIEHLEHAMKDATNEADREAIRRILEKEYR